MNTIRKHILWVFLPLLIASISCNRNSGEPRGGTFVFSPNPLIVDNIKPLTERQITLISTLNDTLYIESVTFDDGGTGAFSTDEEFPLPIPPNKDINFTILIRFQGYQGPTSVTMSADFRGEMVGTRDLTITVPQQFEISELPSPGRESFPVHFVDSDTRVLFNSGILSQRRMEIYTVGIGGDSLVQLTDNGFFNYAVDYSSRVPEGRILYYSNASGSQSVYTMDLDGSNKQQLTDNAGKDTPFAFSPRTQEVFVYQSNRSGNRDIYLYDNGQTRRLTNAEGEDKPFLFSTDGSQLVFTSTRSGDQEIYVIDLADSPGSEVRLSENPGLDKPGAISPENRIAFVSSRGQGDEIYTMDLAGEAINRITNNGRYDEPTAYSNDGRYLLLYATELGNVDGYIFDTQEGRETRLTYSFAEDYPIQFSSNGNRVLLQSDRTGQNAAYIINLQVEAEEETE